MHKGKDNGRERRPPLQSAGKPERTRPFGEASYVTLKAYTRHLIKACGGLDAASLATRVAASLISRYENRDRPEFMPADIVLDLEAFGGEPFVTRALAHAQGYALLKIGGALSDPELAGHMARIGKEMGEFFDAAAATLNDKDHDHKPELRRLLSETDDVLRVVGNARASLQRRLDEER